MSTRTRKFGPERALLDPRERFLHKTFKRSTPLLVRQTCEVLFCYAVRFAARQHAKFFEARVGVRGPAPAGEGAEAHDLQPVKVFGVSA